MGRARTQGIAGPDGAATGTPGGPTHARGSGEVLAPAEGSDGSVADGSTTPRGWAVAVDDLQVTFGELIALDEVSLRIPAGTSVALIGPNGSGKTTLLHALAGLHRPSAGQVSVAPSARPIAYVLQQRHSRHWLPLTVIEVLHIGRYARRGLFGRLGRVDKALVADAAERLEVDGLARRQFGTLSGGQRQRVLVAQALVQQPRLLLMDEPVTGLDLVSQHRILEIVGEEAAQGVTVVMSSHQLDDARRCDTVVLLAGHLVAAGPPEEVLTVEHLTRAYAGRVLSQHDAAANALRPPAATPPGQATVVDDHGHGTPPAG